MSTATESLSADEQRLADLGYKQELKRGWSSFSNFAISFSIISVLAGCFTSYGQAFLNGGPVAISIGWPVISLLILCVAVSMSELASAFPTAGGIYFWASRLGGAGWGWFTGWFNLIGLVAVVASVDFAAASFLQFLLSLYGLHFIFDFTSTNLHYNAHVVFALFAIILLIHGLINVFSGHLVSIFNGISVWWHVAGVAVIVILLVAVPSHHASLSYVFTGRAFGQFNHSMYWFYVLPLGFLLTMYTITGYDASAHVSEETHGASVSAARGVWRSVAYSALIGWVLLLALTFAVQQKDIKTISTAGFPALAIITSALSSSAAKAVILISTIGQLFCGMACVTSASRMTFAFSRDGAIPGHSLWRRRRRQRHPDLRGAVRVPDGADRHHPGLLPQRGGNPGGLLRRDLDRGHRALHRLHDSGLPALADEGGVQRRTLDPGAPLPMDQPDRVHLGRAVRDHLLPAGQQSGRCVLQERLQLEPGQLRPDRDHRGHAGGDDLVPGLGQANLHRTGADDRVRR